MEGYNKNYEFYLCTNLKKIFFSYFIYNLDSTPEIGVRKKDRRDGSLLGVLMHADGERWLEAKPENLPRVGVQADGVKTRLGVL